MSASTPTPWLEFARAVVASYGYDFTDVELDVLLWEHTGFPGFWPNRDLTAQANCEMQLRRYIEEGPLPLDSVGGRPIVEVGSL